MVQNGIPLQHTLERHILARTGRRVRDLTIEVQPEHVVLRGRASTYYIKQLAQTGVRDILPDVPLENAITVDRAERAALAP
jgi:hypothetical protein